MRTVPISSLILNFSMHNSTSTQNVLKVSSLLLSNSKPNLISVLHDKGKKVKVHILDIAPLRSESPLQKRSGMARVLKGFHSFTCTPTRSSAIRMSHTCLCLPSYNWYSFTDPGWMEAVSRPWCEVAQAEIRTCNLPIANPAVYHTATSAPAMCD